MRIAVLAPSSDTFARDLVRHLEALRPGAPIALDMELNPEHALRLCQERASLGTVDLAAVGTVLVSGFRYMDPVVPAPATDADWSVWRADYIQQQQRFSTQYTLLAELERHGIDVLNPVSAYVRAFSKPDLLDTLQASGVPVPEVLCTNDAEPIAAFRARHSNLVWRPTTGRAAWQLFRARQQEDLVTAHKPPILLAPILPGALIRVWLCRGEPLLCIHHALPDDDGLESLERFAPVVLSAEAIEICAKAATTLRMPWCQITCVAAPTGIVIYDIDADPRVDWLPVALRESLLGNLARRLAALPLVSPLGVAAAGLERPLPFLRRMLRDLFIYEASKYPTEPGA